MKWFLGASIVLSGLLWVVYLVAGWRLAPLNDEARAKAPGAFLSLPEGQLHYRWNGPEDGPVIVMVHGFSTPNFIYEQNADALAAAGYRVLRYDHFGRGWSDRPRVRYDVDFYDRTLLGLLDGLEVTGPVGLVGLSMGGPITAEFTARRPERVDRLFLFVPAGFDLAGADSFSAQLVRLPLIGDWIWRMSGRSILLGDPQYDEAALAQTNRLQGDVAEQMDYRGYLDALLSTLRHMPMAGRDETFARLAATDVPVMAVFGDADPTVLISSAEKLSRTVPNAKIEIISGGTHGLNYQRHEEVQPMLLKWFGDSASQD